MEFKSFFDIASGFALALAAPGRQWQQRQLLAPSLSLFNLFPAGAIKKIIWTVKDGTRKVVGGWNEGKQIREFCCKSSSSFLSLSLRVLTKPFRIITHRILKCDVEVAHSRSLKSPGTKRRGMKRDPSKRRTSCSFSSLYFILFSCRGGDHHSQNGVGAGRRGTIKRRGMGERGRGRATYRHTMISQPQ